MSDRVGRPTENAQLTVIDPQRRLIGLHLYDGLLKAIPLEKGMMKEAVNIRIEELSIMDMVFLDDMPKPTIALLYEVCLEFLYLFCSLFILLTCLFIYMLYECC